LRRGVPGAPRRRFFRRLRVGFPAVAELGDLATFYPLVDSFISEDRREQLGETTMKACLGIMVALLSTGAWLSARAQTCRTGDDESCNSTYHCGGTPTCVAGYTCCNETHTCLIDTYTNCWKSTGQSCSSAGECVTDSCPGAPTGTCAQVGLGGQCGTNADCTTGECYQNNHTCVQPPGGACSGAGDNTNCGSNSCSGTVCNKSGEYGFCVSALDCTGNSGYPVCVIYPEAGGGFGYCYPSCITGDGAECPPST
jgi:hypothetical protein